MRYLLIPVALILSPMVMAQQKIEFSFITPINK